MRWAVCAACWLWQGFCHVWRTDRAAAASLILAIASALMWPAAWLVVGADDLPAHAPPGYDTYFERDNWWTIPFVFAGAAIGLWLTWPPMLAAWRHLRESGVLRKTVGGEPGEADADAAADYIQGWSKRLFGIVLVCCAVLYAFDLRDRDEIWGATYQAQISGACEDPFFLGKWVFDAAEPPALGLSACSPLHLLSAEGRAAERPSFGDGVFLFVLLAQQFLVMLMFTLAMGRLALHTAAFALFERTRVARERGLSLRLNPTSPIGEFGLERWNFALNNIYWASIPPLAAVFVTRNVSVSTAYTLGQEALGLIVPLCLLGPMVATIIVRQLRLPAVWREVQAGGPDLHQAYAAQALWPLDRNWTSKLGILLAFALAAISIGYQIDRLLFL